MRDLLDLLDEAARLRRRGEPYAVTTVVRLEGPGYRRPGARMLVAPDGRTVGAVSGGCLEAEVARLGVETLETGRPRLAVFEPDEESGFGYNTGCGGTLTVLLEPHPQPDRLDVTELLAEQMRRRSVAVLVTITEADNSDLLGRRLFLTAAGEVCHDLPSRGLVDRLRAHAQDVLTDERSAITSDSGLDLLVEVLRPRIRVAVFGGGYDAGPLVRQAGLLGWQTVLVGTRPAEGLAERFPEADEHVFLMHPEEAAAQVALDARTAAVIMSHNYVRDRALLGALLDSEAGYVGALGPRSRTERMLADLEKAGRPLGDERLARLYAPVGLDVGTETPEEIALAIVAEVQAAFQGREGGSLRNRAAPIHEAVARA